MPIAYYDEKRSFGLLNKRLQVLIAWLIPQKKNLDMDPKKIYLWRQSKYSNLSENTQHNLNLLVPAMEACFPKDSNAKPPRNYGGFFTFLWQNSFTKGEKPMKIGLLGVAIIFGIFVLSQLSLAIPVMAESTNIYAAPGCISFLFEDLFQEAIS